MVCYGAVVVLWVVPDRRIDRVVRSHSSASPDIGPGLAE